jgi:hypothetical protein
MVNPRNHKEQATHLYCTLGFRLGLVFLWMGLFIVLAFVLFHEPLPDTQTVDQARPPLQHVCSAFDFLLLGAMVFHFPISLRRYEFNHRDLAVDRDLPQVGLLPFPQQRPPQI